MKTPFTEPVMAKLHLQVGKLAEFKPAKPSVYFKELVASVVSQQLSTKVADTIFNRLKELVGKDFSPSKVLALDPEELRAVGLSYSKASYIQNIARAWQEGLVKPQELNKLADGEIIDLLVQIKGVGRWTAEMFLMFTMARPDVFSAGDYGLKKAISLHYNLPLDSKPVVFNQLASQWKPHRTLASRLLWRSLD